MEIFFEILLVLFRIHSTDYLLKRRLGFSPPSLCSFLPQGNNKRRCQDTPFASEVYSKMTTRAQQKLSLTSTCWANNGSRRPDLPSASTPKVNALLPLTLWESCLSGGRWLQSGLPVLTTITLQGKTQCHHFVAWENSRELREVQSVREQGWGQQSQVLLYTGSYISIPERKLWEKQLTKMRCAPVWVKISYRRQQCDRSFWEDMTQDTAARPTCRCDWETQAV